MGTQAKGRTERGTCRCGHPDGSHSILTGRCLHFVTPTDARCPCDGFEAANDLPAESARARA